MSQHLQIFLDRLEHVRQSGNGWRADCPAHDDKRSALIINEADDGRLLILCYAECSALEIVHSVGLELKDLFPVRITKDMKPQQRREIQQEIKLSGWAAAGESLRHEARVLQVASQQIKAGEPLNNADNVRLEVVIDRITLAVQVLKGRRLKNRGRVLSGR